MTWRLIVAFVLLLCVGGCGLAATFNQLALVDAVNAKLATNDQFAALRWYATKTFKLHCEYRSLYPDGKLLARQGVLVAFALFCLLLAATLIGFGLFAIAWLGAAGGLVLGS